MLDVEMNSWNVNMNFDMKNYCEILYTPHNWITIKKFDIQSRNKYNRIQGVY